MSQRKSPPPRISLRPVPKKPKVTQAQVDEAKRAIDAVPGALVRTGKTQRLMAAAARLGLKVK
jgi:hypothetical protein